MSRRGVTVEEVMALSEITGFPAPEDLVASEYDRRRALLSPERQATLDQLLDALEAAEARDREAGSRVEA